MLPFVAIFFALAYFPLCRSQTPLPSETATGVRIAAIVPTSSGEIGINPVDILPTESVSASIGVDTAYLTETVIGSTTSTKWIGVDKIFGTATITKTATDGKAEPTTIPNAVRVVKNAAGELEFTLSELMQEKIAAIRAEMPADLKQRRSIPGVSPRSLRGRAPPVDTTALRQRVGWMSGRLRETTDIMDQMANLEGQVVSASGSDAATLASNNRMMAFTNEETVTAILTSTEADAAAVLGVSVAVLGVFASFAFFVTYLEDWWKWRADPQPMSIFPSAKTSSPSSCPTRRPACDGAGCQGDDGDKCTVNYKGCSCMASAEEAGAEYLYSNWEDIAQQIQIFIPGPGDDAGTVPNATCATSTQANIVDFDKSTFELMIDNFCSASPTLSKSTSKNLTTSDVGQSGFDKWSVGFDLKSTSDCSGYQCNDVFGKFLTCTKNSHTMVKSGTVDLDCGTASFNVNQPPKTTFTPGQPICATSINDATPRMLQISTAVAIDEFCKYNFTATASSSIAMKGGAVAPFFQWFAYDKGANIIQNLVPRLVASKDKTYCGPNENYDKVSGAVSVDRCKEHLEIALNGCAPFSKPDDERFFMKYPAHNFQDCWLWEIQIIGA